LKEMLPMTRRRIAVLLGFVLATGVAALLVESEDERRTELAATGYAPTELSVAVAEAVASTR
jgi:hypothetical protein